MDKDIVPGLLDTIYKSFDERYKSDKTIQSLLKKLDAEKADYVDANRYAEHVGRALSETLGEQITVEVLPDGRMYYNIANRVMSDTLHNNYELVSDYAVKTQQSLNDQAGIHIRAQSVPYNEEKADGLIQTLSASDDFQKSKWLLKGPVENFTQSVVDDTVKANIDFHVKAGLHPKIIRKAAPDCCDWCNEIAGEYLYGQEPKDVFRRHDNCACMCVYDPRDWTNKRQDVWTKNDLTREEEEKLAERKVADRRARKKTREKQSLSGTIDDRPRKTVSGHPGTPRDFRPNGIVDKIDATGRVVDRSFYDERGRKEKGIHMTDHGNPAMHDFGEDGVHVTIFTWKPDGSLLRKTNRAISKEERLENADLFEKD